VLETFTADTFRPLLEERFELVVDEETRFEVELTQLDQLDQFRNRGIGSTKETGNWMHAFSEVLTAPPAVEILHVDGAEAK